MRMNVIIMLSLLVLSGQQAFAADLPNRSVTPGVADSRVTQGNLRSTICSYTKPSWSKSNRPPSSYTSKLKRRQIAQYGYAETNMRNYEEDHLIPISVGGDPHNPGNLWPEPRNTITEWGAEKKDALEFAMFKAVCKGDISLAEAQSSFTGNWIKSYTRYENTLIRKYHFRGGAD